MKIGVLGASGRMSKEVIKQIINNSELTLAGVTTRNDSPLINNDVGQLIGAEKTGIIVCEDIELLMNNSDIVIDFTIPEYSLEAINFAAKENKPIVSGTTGFTEEQFQKIIKVSCEIPFLWSSNMSIGINLLTMLAKIVATKLDDSFDIEIIEAHHRNKVDAPSGTAISLGKAIANAKNSDFNEIAILNRNQVRQKRQQKQIGFSSIRGGNIVGDHLIQYIGDNEIIELSHKAIDRSIFAKGAIKAAQWLIKQKSGFYSIEDVLL